MATELAQAYVQILPSMKGIKQNIADEMNPAAESAGKSAGSRLGSLIKRAIAAAGIGAALKAALSEGAALEQSIGGVETLFKDSASIVKQYAVDAYKTAGLSANAYMGVVERLIGKEGKERLYDHLRTEDGRVPIEAFGRELGDIIRAIGETEKNS